MAHPRIEAVTSQAIVRVSRKLTPKRIQKWRVVVSGREFPVKQLLMEAANSLDVSAPRVTPADFVAHDAVRRLRNLGFLVKYSG